MDDILMNKKCIRLLEEWDPFGYGQRSYETEIADVVAALQGFDDPTQIAKNIQTVYEASFEQWIPLEKCMEIAYQLIAVKFEAKCII
ncbi:DUF1871 family protein [Paenisporosarcina cavernae]|uniref:DUF1871 family protein n=1 Tax=Paenisporosarcina cavernae TaxID=2320858 RepID=A0A385YT06_9BACL|nr:DUF1871 family protein [Paenisporosarcina cavernae]AYC29939.1 DUF1871 family protein [Paenisporosarcina cavernae]